jgi:hypothetical protein
MKHVYAGAPALQRTEKVGDKECVALIQHYTKAGWTGRWRAGQQVVGGGYIAPGTAIATFENGRWPLRPNRKHAAFYLRADPEGFWVIDQYRNRPLVQSRRISFQTAKDRAKAGYSPSNDAEMYYVIETP